MANKKANAPKSNHPVVFVGIEAISGANQFLMLPSTFTYKSVDYRLVTTDGKFNDVGGLDLVLRPISNSNDFISKPDNVHYHKVNGKVVYLERVSKTTQQTALAYAVDKYENEIGTLGNFFNLGAAPINNIGRFKSVFSLPDNIGGRIGYVVKPEGGARSVCIMKFPTSTNIRLFANKLSTLVKSISTESELIKLVNDFGGAINLGTARHPNDIVEFLKDEDTRFIIQNQSPVNAREFRVLKSGNTKLVVCKRNHLSEETNEFETLYEGLTDTDLEIELGIHGCEERSEMLSSIQDFITSSFFPLSHGSIDLWIDTSTSVMKWGIYEYQPQFNHAFIADNVTADFLKASIASMYEAY